MNHLQITAILILAFSFLSASCDERKENAQQPPAELLSPVETQQPNTNYTPAFKGQTRIAGVRTTTPMRQPSSRADSPARGLSLPSPTGDW